MCLHKRLIGMRYGNITAIINININSIGYKLSLAGLATNVVFTSHKSYMLLVAGGQKDGVIIDTS